MTLLANCSERQRAINERSTINLQLETNIMALSTNSFLGVTPEHKGVIIREWIRTEFKLWQGIIEHCDEYYLRVWDSSFVINTVRANGDGTLNGAIVHWASVPTVVASSKRCACSFRTYRGTKYVVLKVWNVEIAELVGMPEDTNEE